MEQEHEKNYQSFLSPFLANNLSESYRIVVFPVLFGPSCIQINYYPTLSPCGYVGDLTWGGHQRHTF